MPSTRVTAEIDATLGTYSKLYNYVNWTDQQVFDAVMALPEWTLTDAVDFIYLLRNGERPCTAADLLLFHEILAGLRGGTPPPPPWRT